MGKINAIFDKLASNHKPKQTHNNKWFDNDCKNIRKTLRKLSNQKHRDPDNQNIRLRYYDTLKHTLRAKKDQHTRTQLSEIEESLESNKFWQKWNLYSNYTAILQRTVTKTKHPIPES